MEMAENGRKVAHVSLTDAVKKGPPPAGNLAVPIFGHGSLEVSKSYRAAL